MNFDFKPLAIILIGFSLGLMAGYQINVDAQAHAQAAASCGVCQDNLGRMVYNFNLLSKECSEARAFNVSEALHG